MENPMENPTALAKCPHGVALISVLKGGANVNVHCTICMSQAGHRFKDCGKSSKALKIRSSRGRQDFSNPHPEVTNYVSRLERECAEEEPQE